jgi:hypothetical protein
MSETAEPKPDRWETLVAVLIAFVTVVGALVAWRASVAADSAGDADFGGLRAALNAEEARALNAVNAYEAYGAFTTYKRHDDLGNLLEEDLAQAADPEALESELADTRDLALANQSLFPNKFLNRDGTYALQRQLGEMWADAKREKDVNPDPQFAEADRFRDKTNWMLVALTVLALALVFYTLVEAVGDRLKPLMLGLGTLVAVAGSLAALWIEFRM